MLNAQLFRRYCLSKVYFQFRWRPGDADLDTFDIIREFHLDRYESLYESVTRVEGSKTLQTAYHLEEKANLTMRSHEAFPRGVPHEFSFECSYRAKQKQQEPWHLFLLTNSFEESQLSLTMNPDSETLSLSLPDVNGDLQMVEYRSASVKEICFLKLIVKHISSFFSCLTKIGTK